MDERTIERLKDAYAALGEGDHSAALAMLAEDCEWRESAELPGANVVRGREAVARFLNDFLESWDRFDQTVEGVVAGEDKVGLAIHLTAVGRASGIELDTRYAHVWTLRDGAGVRVDAYREPEAARLAAEAARAPASDARSARPQKPA